VAQPSRGTDRSSGDELQRVLDRLDELGREVASLDRGPSRELIPPPSLSPGDLGRVPAGEAGLDAAELRELVLSIESLRQRLDRTEAMWTTHAQAPADPLSLDELREDKHEVDWMECRNFIDDWKLDQAAAEENLKFTSDRDLMKRFGPPTEVWSNEKGVHWVYGEDYNELTETYETQIFLRLRDGYVTLVDVESQ
jgi:hypothetical protein